MNEQRSVKSEAFTKVAWTSQNYNNGAVRRLCVAISLQVIDGIV